MQNNLNKNNSLQDFFYEALEKKSVDLCLNILSRMVETAIISSKGEDLLGKGRVFSKAFELICDDLTHERAISFGQSFSKWLSTFSDDMITPWAKNTIYKISKNLADLLVDENQSVEYHQVLTSLVIEKRHPQLDRQIGRALAKGYYESWSDSHHQNDQWLNLIGCMKEHGGQSVLDNFAEQTVKSALDSNIGAWQDIFRVYCPASREIDAELVESFNLARDRALPVPGESIFSLMADGNCNRWSFITKIQELIMSSSVDRKTLAKHVDGKKDVDFITQTLNLDIGYVFGISNLMPAAKRAMVSDGLDI
ncbi:hypothetical protein P5704_023935 (plasmid) [Pseudomonas sp. FeN3W]|nr:hypothetical protein P5704_023935 [Pseudomonas sp. FeN3W]